jgi:hypothetical protein
MSVAMFWMNISPPYSVSKRENACSHTITTQTISVTPVSEALHCIQSAVPLESRHMEGNEQQIEDGHNASAADLSALFQSFNQD